MTIDVQIRAGKSDDLDQLVEIYNHYVSNSHVTFDTQPFAIAARIHWFAQFADSGPHRILVAEKDHSVLGYASSSSFKPRAAYNSSVETSVYMHPDAIGQRVGHTLYSALLELLIEEPSLHRAYGGVALPNAASVDLHERLGFKQVATFHEVGFKFDKYWDVSWFEKDLE